MPHDVFISYAHADKPQADAVCARLEGRGIRCWIAPRDIQPGRQWSEALVEAIRTSAVFVLVFSKRADGSAQILREVDRAVAFEVPIIPFRIEDVQPSDALEYYLSVPHWLDALTPPLEKHIEKLADSVQRLIIPHDGQSGSEDAKSDDQSNDDQPSAAQRRRAGGLERLDRSGFCPYCGGENSLVGDPHDATLLRCTGQLDDGVTPCPFLAVKRLRGLRRSEFLICGRPGSGRSVWFWQVVNQLEQAADGRQLGVRLADGREHYRVLKRDGLFPDTSGRERWMGTPAAPFFLECDASKRTGLSQQAVSLIFCDYAERADSVSEPYRRRARQANGFLFLISAHQIGPWGPHVLEELAQDILGDSRRDVPVAVGISKVDTFPRNSPLVRYLADTPCEPAAVSLSEMRKRDRVCRDVFPQLTQGYDIGQHASRLFGSRHMLFPIASLGFPQPMDGLSCEPRPGFGVWEPMAWLLHESLAMQLPEA